LLAFLKNKRYSYLILPNQEEEKLATELEVILGSVSQVILSKRNASLYNNNLSIRGQFHQHFTSRFYARRSQKQKRH